MAKKRSSNQLAFAGIGRRGRAKVARVVRKKRKIKEAHVAEKKNAASPESEMYGKLKAEIHFAAYSFTRACQTMQWLLEESRFEQCGSFVDVNAFLESVNLDKFRAIAEERAALAKLIKDLQPKASNRAIATTLGVDEKTVRRDAAANAAPSPKKPSDNNGRENVPAANAAPPAPAPAPSALPPVISGDVAAKLVQRQELKEVAAVERLEARAAYEARAEPGGKVEDLIALAASGKRFAVILADPPWTFEVYSGKGKERSAERHYDTMSLDDIKALPVAQLAADDCALFLWGVCPEVPGALDVIRAWGFEFKTKGFVWIKTTKNAEMVKLDGDGLHWGMGYHTRANSEDCWLATRGNPQRFAKDVHQVIMAPVREHSRKPDEVHERIEQLFFGDYLELFARAERPGWVTWGNEVEPPIKVEVPDEQTDAKPLEAAE